MKIPAFAATNSCKFGKLAQIEHAADRPRADITADAQVELLNLRHHWTPVCSVDCNREGDIPVQGREILGMTVAANALLAPEALQVPEGRTNRRLPV